MTPQEAARRFVGLVLRSTFDDVLDLTDRVGLDNDAPVHARQSAYAEVETAVRRRFGMTHDLDALERAVHLAAAAGQQADVAIAVNKLMDAVTDELTVKQQAGYVVGLTVGRALDASVCAGLGGGWESPTATRSDAAASAGRLVLDAVIVQEDAPLVPERPYVVWFTLEGHPRTKGFVVGSFETFDAAGAALLAVEGVHVAHIRSEEGDR
jgi:hypothetical protein